MPHSHLPHVKILEPEGVTWFPDVLAMLEYYRRWFSDPYFSMARKAGKWFPGITYMQGVQLMEILKDYNPDNLVIGEDALGGPIAGLFKDGKLIANLAICPCCPEIGIDENVGEKQEDSDSDSGVDNVEVTHVVYQYHLADKDVCPVEMDVSEMADKSLDYVLRHFAGKQSVRWEKGHDKVTKTEWKKLYVYCHPEGMKCPK